MKHRIKKIKFKDGKDANKMLVKKLLTNFIRYGKLTTTEKKAKVLKSSIEKLVEKAKESSQANTNYMLRYIVTKELVDFMYKEVGPVCKDKIGGYVRIEKLLPRASDNASMAQVVWAYPVTAVYTQVLKKTSEEKKPSQEKKEIKTEQKDEK